MKDIFYDIQRIPQQEAMDCSQACAAQMLSFFGISKTIEQVKDEVPVFVDSTGTPLGTSMGHIAAYLTKFGKTTMHISDIQIFDPTWKNLSSPEIIENIKKREPYVKHSVYGSDAIAAICEGFTQFLQKGGEIVLPVVDEEYIYKLLEKGPIYTVLNYQFAFERPRFTYNARVKELEEDTIGGDLSTHSVLIIGYKDDKFCLLDPESSNEAERWVDANRVVGAYYLADLFIDPILITLQLPQIPVPGLRN